MVFVVRHLEADYLAPAHYDDEVLVETERVAVTGSRIVLAQNGLRGDAVLFAAKVTLVCVAEGRAVRFPADMAGLLG